jgi:hypothetical protein
VIAVLVHSIKACAWFSQKSKNVLNKLKHLQRLRDILARRMHRLHQLQKHSGSKSASPT